MKHSKNYYFLLADIFFVLFIPLVALLLRVEVRKINEFIGPDLWVFMTLAVCIKIPIFWKFHLYKSYWRYASLEDLFSIFWAVTSAMTIMGVWVITEKYLNFMPRYGLPRSMIFIDGILTFLAVAGIRFSIRTLTSHKNYTR